MCLHPYPVWLVNFAFSLCSMNSLYRKDPCQSPEPTVPSLAPSFADVAARTVDRNMDKDIHSKFVLAAESKINISACLQQNNSCVLTLFFNGKLLCALSDLAGQYLPEETWSAPSIPLTNEFRYNTTEALPYIPQPATTASYNG